MKGLEEFLANLLEHVRTGHFTMALLLVLVVLFGPMLWHLFWRTTLLRKIEGCYVRRIRGLEDSMAQSQAAAQHRILLLERALAERDTLLRERDQQVVAMLRAVGEAKHEVTSQATEARKA
jgi:hypothetical protein